MHLGVWFWRCLVGLWRPKRRRLPRPQRAKSSLYTRQGDHGYTRILGGPALPKYAAVCEAMGDVDELSAKLGIAAFHSEDAETRASVEAAQRTLLEAGAVLASLGPSTGDSRTRRLARRALDPSVVRALEVDIDDIDASLPPLRHFVIPQAPLAALALHDARVVCRRAERHVWAVAHEAKDDDDDHQIRLVATYLNRLSDYLFAAARLARGEEDDRGYDVSATVRRRLRLE